MLQYLHVPYEVRPPVLHLYSNLVFSAAARFPLRSMFRSEVSMENKRLSGATGENGTNGDCKFCVKFNFSKFSSHDLLARGRKTSFSLIELIR
jgi:hypothetical protein